LFKGRPAKASLNLCGGGAVTIIGLTAGLIGLNLQGYARLTYEVPLAEVHVQAVDAASKTYTVTVKRLDESQRVTTCTLQGDAWEIGGRFQKWKPWANELGLDSTYTLDQISNRYYMSADGNGKPITSCDLNVAPSEVSHVLPDSVTRWVLSHLLVKERFFGSASFMPMADGATYKVIATQFGFNAEPANEAATTANNARAF